MIKREFEKIIDKDKYQVFLFVCPTMLPFSFAAHHWFVVNNKGAITRWESGFEINNTEEDWGHVQCNFYKPYQGIGIIPFQKLILWPSKLVRITEGDEESEANKIVNFILSSPNNYPYCKQYALNGPNSNTYIQWVINHFPETNFKLRNNAFGKEYQPESV